MTVTAASCGLTSHGTRTASPHVLGQPKGTPLVVGKPAPAGVGELGAVSCASERRCWAVGVAGPNPSASPGGAAVIVATSDGGSSWTAEHVTGGSTPQLSGVACPTSTRCMAVGSNGSSLPGSGVVVTTTDAGRTWAPVSAPPNVLSIVSVWCTRGRDCTAVVNGGTSTWTARSTDFGATWQQEGSLPASFQPGDDIFCAGETCLVAGYVPTSNGHGQGALAASGDGGQTWALATVPTGTGILRAATCISTSECLAAGTTSTTVSDVVPAEGELLRSGDGGRTWAASGAPVPVNDVYGLACPTVRLCAMVGTKWVGIPAVGTGAVAQSPDGGTDFSPSTAAYTPTTLEGISCPGNSTCVAVGGGTVARIKLVAPRRAAPSTTAGGASTTTSTTTTTSS